MSKAIRASALILLLACSAQAGHMQNDAPTPPPPSQPASTVQEPTGAVEEPTTGGIMGNDAADSLTQTALDLFAALSSLL